MLLVIGVDHFDHLFLVAALFIFPDISLHPSPCLFIAALPVFTSAVSHADSPQSTELAMAPIFASPLHEETTTERANGAASPPMFIQSFESAEETLPFQLSIADSSLGDWSAAPLVVATPVVEAQAQSSSLTEEVQEELVELEIKAELKWAKS